MRAHTHYSALQLVVVVSSPILAALIAQLDGQIGHLERNVRERISVASALDLAIARLTRDSTELAERLIARWIGTAARYAGA